jgi:hypothetical protein
MSNSGYISDKILDEQCNETLQLLQTMKIENKQKSINKQFDID